MRQLTKIDEIQAYVLSKRNGGCSIGFVPTMGALHAGHLSLVAQSNDENSVTIVSIFVNPTQFNSEEDLEKYPRTLEADLILLKESGCDAVFIPEVVEIYSKDFIPQKVDLGLLDTTMEGFYRPGHFEGVVTVVQRLFSIVVPDQAYFGRKDFQQVAVIRQMVDSLKLNLKVVEVQTEREESGLAMSSRNTLLSDEQKLDAAIISKILLSMIESAKLKNPSQVKKDAIQAFSASDLQLEYLEIVHPRTFESLDLAWVEGATACVVAYCGKIRLIDNMEIIPIVNQ